MRKCVTRRAPSSSSAGAIPICYGGDRLSQAPPCPCMKYQIRNFFDGGRHAEGRDVERYGARERAEEEGRIRRRPRRTRGGRGGAGCAVFTNPDKESRQTRRREEIGCRISLFKLSYGETRQRNLLSTLSILRFARLRQNTVTRSSY